MSTTCLYSDIVLPTATWYEKNDLNTSDMHPFIHPLSAAVDPAWEARNDWEIYKGFAKKFSEVCVGHLGVEKELVLTPLMHDTPGELAQALDVQGVEERRMRAGARQDRAGDDGDRARLPEHLQEVHRAGAADGEGRQRRQGHRLEYRARGAAARRTQLRRHRRGHHQGPAADRDRHRRVRGDPDAGAGDQRRGGGEGLGGAVENHRPRARAPGARRRKTRNCAFATCRRSRARSFPARPGAASSRRRSATTPAGPTSTS